MTKPFRLMSVLTLGISWTLLSMSLHAQGIQVSQLGIVWVPGGPLRTRSWIPGLTHG
jgi:hypothetical protein